MIKRTWLLILLLWLPYSAQAANEYQDNIRYSSIPDWVEHTQYQRAEDTESSEGAVRYLLVDNQINFSDGQHSDYIRIAQQIINRQGLSQASELYFGFNPDYQQLDIHTIQVIRNGEVVDQTDVELNTMRQEQDLNNRILTGQVTALAILKDVQEGDIIEYAYTIHGSNPVFNGKKFLYINTSWLVNVDRAKVLVKTDKASPLNHKTTGTKTRIQTGTLDNYLVYRWEDTDIPAEANEHSYPHWYQHFNALEFSEFETWQDVANWAADLYNFDISPNKQLLALNHKWRQEANSDKDYVKKVVSFVQNDIRYFGLELAENSHKPRDPNLVFERRYGDCKDKALMISWLLEQHDIQSWSALVSGNTLKGVEERLPSPGAFDHVINKVVLGDEVFWIDGTNMGQPGDLTEISTNQFGRALIIDRNSADLEDMTLTEMVPWKNYLNETFTSKGYDKPVELFFEITLSGSEAQYSKMTLAAEGNSAMASNILDYYKRQYPSGEWSSELIIDDKSEENLYQMRGTITIQDYWDTKAKHLTVTLYGEHISTYLSLPEQVNRVTPLDNYENIDVKHDITWILHEEIDWDLSTDKKSFATDAFVYNRDVSVTPGKITVNHAYTPQNSYIETSKVSAYMEKVKAAREALYYSIVIENKDTRQVELRNRMRSLLKL